MLMRTLKTISYKTTKQYTAKRGRLKVQKQQQFDTVYWQSLAPNQPATQTNEWRKNLMNLLAARQKNI